MIRAVISDVEGTTTADFFVKEVLFGYARKRVRRFLTKHQDDPAVAALIERVKTSADEPDAELKRVIKILQSWMDEDRKEPVLKELQGLMWEDGYRTQQFLGHIFPDVYRNLLRWQREGRSTWIYSSGSVLAQRLLLEHTTFGDVRPQISGYFDTGIGPKLAVESYRAIAAETGVIPAQTCFLSDTPGELAAASEAGMHGIRLVREEEKEDDDQTWPICYDFDEVSAILEDLDG